MACGMLFTVSKHWREDKHARRHLVERRPALPKEGLYTKGHHMFLPIFRLILCHVVVLTPSPSSSGEAPKSMDHEVKKTNSSFIFEQGWCEGQWANANPLRLAHFMGARPEHFPDTQVKLLYDKDNLYVFFRVKDQYVRAVTEAFHDPVCQDSCVEFFFACGEDITKGYFNLEVNCGGTLLFYHQIRKGQGTRAVSTEDCRKIKVISSLPKKVDPEITQPIVWTVKYAVPIAVLKKYACVTPPGPGTVWKANFYKCADKTSHPHWLTWNPVDRPSPNFHLPQYFGTMVFE